MIYYRVAIRKNYEACWYWKSPLFKSLHGVLGILNFYRAVPQEHIRVFRCTTSEHMDVMLERANQGMLSTAIPVKQLYDPHCMNWMEVRRLEVEAGEGGDHDQPYAQEPVYSRSQVFAWNRLRTKRACGELTS